jgi:hypothetical protein
MENINNNVGNNNFVPGHYIIPEWKRAKDAILDSYLLVINAMSEVMPKMYARNQIPQSRLDDWRKGIIAVFYQIREHEPELLKIKSVKELLFDIDTLIGFTDLVLNTQTLKEIKNISRKKDNDPIIEYKKEAYK